MISENNKLREIYRQRCTVSQREFGRISGIGSGPMVSQYLSGTRPLNLSAALKFSKALGVPIEAFSPTLARLATAAAQNVSDAPPPESGTLVPVVSWIQAGLPQDVGQLDADEWIRTTVNCSRSSYALRVRGDSMTPDFRDGDLIVIDENVAPVPGDFVAARIERTGETTFKRYALRGFDSSGREIFDLQPLNPLYPTINSAELGASVIGTMIEHRRFRRR